MPSKKLRIIHHKNSANFVPEDPGDTGKIIGPSKTTKANEETKKGSLLFVHRDQRTVIRPRSAGENEAIKAHLANRHQKRSRADKKLSIHPSLSRILLTPSCRNAKGVVGYEPGIPAAQSRDARELVLATQMNSLSLLVNMPHLRAIDPFSWTASNFSPDLWKLVHSYFKIIQPLAKSISPKWRWCNNVALIQGSTMLSSAIAAYVSAFTTGFVSGSRDIVVPSVSAMNGGLLWQLPKWYQFQCKAIMTLNQALSEQHTDRRDEIYQTVLFLLRIATLFGDGHTARLHHKALQQLEPGSKEDVVDIDFEFAVANINMVTVSLYKSCLVMHLKQQRPDQPATPTLLPIRHRWGESIEWDKFRGMLLARRMAWVEDQAENDVTRDAIAAMLAKDPYASQLNAEALEDMGIAYRTCTYLWHFLTGVAFDPALPKIRQKAFELRSVLERYDLCYLDELMPNALFVMLFMGAFANRGFFERSWFIEQMKGKRVQIQGMRDLYVAMNKFTDAVHARALLLEELVVEIRASRTGDYRQRYDKDELYQGTPYFCPRGETPIDWTLDLETPVPQVIVD